LKIRPIYQRLAHRILAILLSHSAAINYIKNSKGQLEERNLKLSAAKAAEIMQSIFRVTTKLPVSKKSVDIIMAKTFEQQMLLKAFEEKY
jgi:hypothetical protein